MKDLFDKVSLECSKNVTNSYSTSFSLATKMLSKTFYKTARATCELRSKYLLPVRIFSFMQPRTILNNIKVQLRQSKSSTYSCQHQQVTVSALELSLYAGMFRYVYCVQEAVRGIAQHRACILPIEL